jgi:hypothetical protein
MDWLSRTIAVLGAVLVLVSIWVKSFEGFRNWDDGTNAAYLLASVLLTVALLTIALVTKRPAFSLAAAVVALLACGFLISTPVFLAFNQFDFVRAGLWIGVVGGVLLGAGALMTYLAEQMGPADVLERKALSASPPTTTGAVYAPTPATEIAAKPAAPAGAPLQESTAIPAGWYPDPAGGAGQRYWDGQKWTGQTSN